MPGMLLGAPDGADMAAASLARAEGTAPALRAEMGDAGAAEAVAVARPESSAGLQSAPLCKRRLTLTSLTEMRTIASGNTELTLIGCEAKCEGCVCVWGGAITRATASEWTQHNSSTKNKAETHHPCRLMNTTHRRSFGRPAYGLKWLAFTVILSSGGTSRVGTPYSVGATGLNEAVDGVLPADAVGSTAGAVAAGPVEGSVESGFALNEGTTAS